MLISRTKGSRKRTSNITIVPFRIHNRIAESVLTLPFCVGITAFLWCFPLLGRDPEVKALNLWYWELELPMLWVRFLGGLLVALITAAVISETNNAQQIIRIRTRLMSSFWLLFIVCLPEIHPCVPFLLCALAYALALMLLFRLWQTDMPVLPVFHCMLCLSLGSLFWFPLIFLSLPFFAHILGIVRSFSWRSFWAGLVGLLLPYWLWFLWGIWSESFKPLKDHLLEIRTLTLPTLQDYLEWPVGMQGVWALLTVTALVGFVHYLMTSYNDKLRVRSLLRIYLIESLLLQTLLFFQPRSWSVVLPMLIVASTPFIAHLFALTRNRLTGLFFWMVSFSWLALVVLQLWGIR